MTKLTDVDRARRASLKMADENAKLRAAVRNLTSEVNRLRAQDERWQAMIGQQAELVGKSRREAAHLRGLLRQVEWSKDADGWLVCPMCAGYHDSGHNYGCDLAAALEGDE